MINDAQLILNIKYVMKREHWTQRGLAHAIGMKEGTVSKILTGRRPLKALELAAIAEGLNVSVDDLLETPVLHYTPKSSP
jgi:transcriptional regulator with XRE-family HTH domain